MTAGAGLSAAASPREAPSRAATPRPGTATDRLQRLLAEVPGIEERSALSRTIAKLEAAAGEAAAASAQVAVQVDDHAARGVLAQAKDALARSRRIHLSYYVPGRDEATERDVDPMRLLVVE